MEFEAARRMPADSAIVFQVASDVSLMDRWLPRGLHVDERGAGVLDAEGELVPEGHHEGLFRVSKEQLRVDWGGRDDPEYAGWLQVADSASGTSEITVHISLPREPDGEGPSMQQMLDWSLDRLSEEVTRRVSDAG